MGRARKQARRSEACDAINLFKSDPPHFMRPSPQVPVSSLLLASENSLFSISRSFKLQRFTLARSLAGRPPSGPATTFSCPSTSIALDRGKLLRAQHITHQLHCAALHNLGKASPAIDPLITSRYLEPSLTDRALFFPAVEIFATPPRSQSITQLVATGIPASASACSLLFLPLFYSSSLAI